MNTLRKALEERKSKALCRMLPHIDEGIDFFSNDYLGLARSMAFQELIESNYQVLEKLNGATGSRLLSGNTELVEQTEVKIANFHQAEAALIYNSGYTANLGLLSSIAIRNTTLVMDELCHASLIDGARLGKAHRIRFRHNDATDLRAKLEKASGEKIVVVESVYSMDGDISPLTELTELCNAFNALLIVDEAHSIGVFGSKGEGLAGQLALENKIFARIITYGKAPGIHGAAVIGSQWLKDYQVNFSRPFVFSTAPAPHQINAISGFYDFIPTCQLEREKLQEVITYFVRKRADLGGWLASHSQIQSLVIPGNEAVLETSKRLKKSGINALPIRRPSVREGKERIRFCLHSYNTKEEIDQLFERL